MTEKRLKVDEEFLPFMSKIKLTDGRLITPMELVDRYNIILKENEQLKQTNQELNDELQETMGYLSLKSGIERENEQLKQQSNSVYEIVKEYVMSHHCISTMRILKKIEKVMWND